MHYADIISALVKAGHPPIRVASELGVSPGAVSQVIRGNTKSRKIATRISRITRTPIETLWPGKYQLDRRRQRKTRRAAA